MRSQGTRPVGQAMVSALAARRFCHQRLPGAFILNFTIVGYHETTRIGAPSRLDFRLPTFHRSKAPAHRQKLADQGAKPYSAHEGIRKGGWQSPG